ncbi:EAL domain-containing protein [Psychrosphaera algicola]|uniref:EAL domain-containing protein n=1 Tax=Psychrosphaera algicola TaxID=3023714 RepID=A0ABT5FHT4_9GAMM|nr:EAL domain-containing protein [Psychrosphaera sp. G1-22]MDC2890759.1 EAL domain-containing protein [Psychrosphaera sp. G1-22]
MCVYSHDIKLKLKERAKLESDLAKALDEGEIDIFYQPQVDASTSKIVGAEALARWHHPELGMISPDVFIPIAESTGLIIDIGNWILCKACKRAKKSKITAIQHLELQSTCLPFSLLIHALLKKLRPHFHLRD